MNNLSAKGFWEKRYNNVTKVFDWLENFESLKNILFNFLKKDGKILVIGSGNSELSEKLYDAGFKNITNIDLSS